MAAAKKRTSQAISGLYRIRLDRGLSAVELATRAGVSRGTIARIETGHPASVAVVGKLARALGMTAGELVAAPPS